MRRGQKRNSAGEVGEEEDSGAERVWGEDRESTKERLSSCLACEKPDALLQMWPGLFNTTYLDQQTGPSISILILLHPKWPFLQPLNPPWWSTSKLSIHPFYVWPNVSSTSSRSGPQYDSHRAAEPHRKSSSAVSVWSQTALPLECKSLTEISVVCLSLTP